MGQIAEGETSGSSGKDLLNRRLDGGLAHRTPNHQLANHPFPVHEVAGGQGPQLVLSGGRAGAIEQNGERQPELLNEGGRVPLAVLIGHIHRQDF